MLSICRRLRPSEVWVLTLWFSSLNQRAGILIASALALTRARTDLRPQPTVAKRHRALGETPRDLSVPELPSKCPNPSASKQKGRRVWLLRNRYTRSSCDRCFDCSRQTLCRLERPWTSQK